MAWIAQKHTAIVLLKLLFIKVRRCLINVNKICDLLENVSKTTNNEIGNIWHTLSKCILHIVIEKSQLKILHYKSTLKTKHFQVNNENSTFPSHLLMQDSGKGLGRGWFQQLFK